MRKTGLALAAFGALAVFLSGCGSNSSSSAGSAYGGSAATSAAMASQPKTTVLTIRKTKVGYVLANARGYTLYWYSRDVKGGGRSVCIGQCLSAWPAGGTVLKTSLSNDDEKELQEALHGSQAAAQ